MTISIVSIAARACDDVCVSFSITDGVNVQSERLVISAASVADLRLCVGECSEECFDSVLAAAQRHEATKRALSLLSYGRHSPKALARKLCGKGISRDVAVEAIRDLIARGYLNPRADAYAEANVGVSKGWGRIRISSALYEKGYSASAVHEALARLDADGVDYAAACASLICRRFSEQPTDPKSRAKMYASLSRYGYTTSDIREALSLLEDRS